MVEGNSEPARHHHGSAPWPLAPPLFTLPLVTLPRFENRDAQHTIVTSVDLDEITRTPTRHHIH